MKNIISEELATWLNAKGKLGLEILSVETNIGFRTLERIAYGKKMNPTELEQTAICKATGISKTKLFPPSKVRKAS